MTSATPTDIRVGLVGLVVKSEVFLVRTRRLPEVWQPVGGMSDDRDVDARATAVREAHEETGVKLAAQDLDFATYEKWDFGEGLAAFFTMRSTTKPVLTLAEDEIVEGRWVDVSTALQLPAMPATASYLRTLQEAANAPRSPLPLDLEGSPESVRGSIGSTLSDRDILALCEAGGLVTDGFKPANVAGSSYELTASDVYYDLSQGKERIVVETGKCILIRPRRRYVLITSESLDIPEDLVAHVVSKGSLFSVGLMPVSTWVDPGFNGRMGIVLFNASDSYIRIMPGRAVAKIEFSRLTTPVIRRYAGQHGFGTGIWPIADDLVLTPNEVAREPAIVDEFGDAMAGLGPILKPVVQRVFRYERFLLIAIFVYLMAFIALFSLTAAGKEMNLWVAVGLGVVTNVATGLLTLLATYLPRWRSSR